MKKRTTRPINNKYYKTKSTGGLNGCIVGKPTITGANVLCNCVGYSNGRFNEIINDPELKGVVKAFKYQLTTNAENFIEAAKSQGLKISSSPVTGGVMVWKKGATLGGKDGAGHVAIVEAVYNDGTILTSESGYNAYAFRTARRDNTNGRWSQPSGYTFRGCVINPAVKSETVPAPKLTIDGIGGPDTVRAMQRFFGTTCDGVISGQKKDNKKYYPSLKSVEYGKGGSPCIKNLQKWAGVSQDGVIGPKTVKAWQKKIGVSADGIFGTKSMKAFQKYLNEHDKAEYPKTPTTTTTTPKPEPTPTTTTSANAKKIIDKAAAYCWPYGTDSKKYAYKTGSAKDTYKAALKKYMNKTAKISQSDCGYFVDTCVRASGLSSSFLALKGTKEAFPKAPSTFKIVHKGKKIPDGLLQPGDIIRYKKTNGGQHTLMYYAAGKIAEAGRSTWFPAIKKDTKKYNGKSVKFNTLEVLRAK